MAINLNSLINLSTPITSANLAPISKGSRPIEYQPYLQKALEPLALDMPNLAGLAMLSLQVEDAKGVVLHRNFMHFEITSEAKIPKVDVITVRPEAFSNASFTKKQWNVLDGLKVNGAGQGYFEYTIPLDSKMDLGSVKEAYFLVEISAKELFVKDLDVKEEKTGDFMLGRESITEW